MKSTILQVCVFALMLLLSAASSGKAQTFDQNRMNQDLKISEGILNQLISSSMNSNLFSPRNANAYSVYLEGYGVVFTIPRQHTFIVRHTGTSSTGGNVVVESRNEAQMEAEKKLKESVTTFLSSYADVIGQLKPDDRITVIYQKAAIGQPMTTRSSDSNTSRDEGFLMSVRKRDLTSLRSGQISERDFASRLTDTQLEPQHSSEVQIFTRVLETGLARGENPSFYLGPGTQFVMSEDFGLLISAQIRAERSFVVMTQDSIVSNLSNVYFVPPSGDSLTFYNVRGVRVTPPVPPVPPVDPNHPSWTEFYGDSLRIQIRDNARVLSEQVRVMSEQVRVMATELRGAMVYNVSRPATNRTAEETVADFRDFEKRLLELLLEYGRTIRSAGPDQMIVLNLTQSRAPEGTPSRIIVSVKKSTLDAYDSRNISREAALRQVQIQHY